MNDMVKELQELIEQMPKLEIENPTEEDKARIAKWIAEIVAKVYLKGLKDGRNSK